MDVGVFELKQFHDSARMASVSRRVPRHGGGKGRGTIILLNLLSY